MVLEWLQQNIDLVVYLVLATFNVLLSVVLGRSPNKYLKLIKKEIETMIYRTQDYQEKEKNAGTSFSNVKKESIFDPDTNSLIETGDVIDLQEQLNSFKDTALDSILDRFMPVTRDELKKCSSDEILVSMQQSKNDLLELGDLLEQVEDYRDQFGLSPFSSVEDILKEASRRRDALTVEIDKHMKKEVNNSEKEKETE